MNIIYFGTPQFAANVLAYLIENKIKIDAVVTKPDKPKGRSGTPIPPPVKVIALENQLPIYQPEKVSDPNFYPTLESYHPDLFIVVAFGEIIKQELLDMPKVACINLHASLLPKYRGAAPIQHAIINGEIETGVSIIHMVKKMDAGDIIKTAKTHIGPNIPYGKFENILCNIGSHTLLDTIHDIENGNMTRTPQDESKVTFAPKIELDDCKIDWTKPALDVHNLVRGVNPHPGAWCLVKVRDQVKRMKLFSTLFETKISGNPGEILAFRKNEFIVACGNYSVRIQELQLEGKKRMSSDNFIKGTSQLNLKIL